MERIAIVGTGGFAREVLTLINAINFQAPKYEMIGFVGLNNKQIIHGFSVIGSDDDINKTKDSLSLVIAVGDPLMKKHIREKFDNPFLCFPTLIHPSVAIGDQESIRFGEGCIVCAGSFLTTDINVGKFVTINLQCTIGHDTVIGDFSSFMPSVNISGEVKIHNGVYIGTGAKVINQIEIGQSTVVGAGAVVTKSLPDRCTAVGVPAKPIKYH